MKTYAISVGKHRSDTKWLPKYYTWAELVVRLRQVRRTAETGAAYWKMSDQKRGKIKDGPGFVGGLVKDGRRKKQNIETRSLLTLDADTAGSNFLADIDLALMGVSYIAYSTHSHSQKQGKFRLIIPLDREVSADEYMAISRRIADSIGLENFDKTTFQAHRLMYFPSCSVDAKPVFVEGEGDPLLADQVLSLYQDWRDVDEWPRHETEKRPAKTSDRLAEDPTKKDGIIGLFCRTYDIETGIEQFLPDVYTAGPQPGRYSYAKGTSINGLQVWADQGLVFSHQDSDPVATGHAYNLFDLVRVHKFGDLDEKVISLTGAGLPSFKAMQAWIAQQPEIKRAKMEELERDFQEIQTGAGEPVSRWEDQLEIHPKTALPLAKARNIRLLLENGDFKGALAYDVFKNVEVILKDVPGLRDQEEENSPGGIWRGCDDAILKNYFAEKYEIEKASVLMNAFITVTRKNSFHPVKSYFSGLVWDGTERAETALITYLGATDSRYVRQVTRKMLLAGVYRIYEPGTKFDQMLVLVGDQDCGKSEFLEKLGCRKWYSDGVKRLGDPKDTGEHLQGNWIFEMAELSALKSAEIDEIKAFISKTTDRYRVAYDRAVSEFPRKGIFFGTTNDREFLKDLTGNRRFWPVAVKRCEEHIWYSLTQSVIDQIWAEVLTWYAEKETLKIDAEVKREATLQQKRYMEDSGTLGMIQKWLDSPIIDEFGRPTEKLREKTCASQILVECLGIKKASFRYEAKNIIGILRNISGWKEENYRHDFPVYGRQTTFTRIGSSEIDIFG